MAALFSCTTIHLPGDPLLNFPNCPPSSQSGCFRCPLFSSKEEKIMELKKSILFFSSLLLCSFSKAICIPSNISTIALAPGLLSPASSPSESPSSSTVQSPSSSVQTTSSPSSSSIQSPQSNPSLRSFKLPSLPLPSLPLPSLSSANPILKQICDKTDYPQVCLNCISPFQTGAVDPISILKMEIQALRKSFEKAIADAMQVYKNPSTSQIVKSCLDTCLEVYDSGVYDLDDALAAISAHDIGRLQTLLSGAMSYASTCEDAFAEEPGVNSPMKDLDDELDKLSSINLAIASLLHWH